MEPFATKVASLAQKLAEILADKLGHNSTFFQQSCLPSSCYLRLNRYPPSPIPSDIYGLMPHTDSDFLTILNQDQVGGLQLVKDGKWIAVKPNPEALIINIGDFFQAWSNGFYNSVEHCVVKHPTKERFSVAYFLCPSNDTVIESCSQPSVYSKFSFREYRQKVKEDVQRYGHKVTADVYAILSALEMITEHGWTDSKPIFTESDSSQSVAVSWVLERNLRPYSLGNLFMDIDRCIYQIRQIRFVCAPRSCNEMADALAKVGLGTSFLKVWWQT
ncbi:hypothetical protein V6N13_011539 [Hibiscus sabdariffa]